ncbi:MAG: hypothetical protein HY059_18520 [Proteobacteria bacterium]|nr:hypothetical protein [Pseudomonadota bacterium]
MRLASFLAASLIAPALHAAMPTDLPSLAPVKIAAVGQAPSETRFPAIKTLNSFRRTPLLIALGQNQYHLSIQAARNGDWHLVVLKRDANVHEPAATFVMRLLAKPQPMTLDGIKFTVKTREVGGRQFVVFHGGSATNILEQEIAVEDIKNAVYEAAVPLPSIGPEWRVVYQRELWRTARMPSLVFFERIGGRFVYHVVGARENGKGVFPTGEKAAGGIVFHLIPANAIDDTREHVVRIGPAKIGLKTDGKGSFVVRTIR